MFDTMFGPPRTASSSLTGASAPVLTVPERLVIQPANSMTALDRSSWWETEPDGKQEVQKLLSELGLLPAAAGPAPAATATPSTN
jgi:hypothetical protein